MPNLTTCSHENCGRPKVAKGLCATHRRQQMRGEELRPLKQYASPSATAQERLALRSERKGDCLVWTGTTWIGGYGVLRWGGRNVAAHRLAWESAHGPIPDGMEIDHACGNRPCIDVAHLRLSTRKQNVEHLVGLKKNNVSGMRGVDLAPNGKKWIARLRHEGVAIYLGRFDTAEEADAAVRAKRAELFTFPEVA